MLRNLPRRNKFLLIFAVVMTVGIGLSRFVFASLADVSGAFTIDKQVQENQLLDIYEVSSQLTTNADSWAKRITNYAENDYLLAYDSSHIGIYKLSTGKSSLVGSLPSDASSISVFSPFGYLYSSDGNAQEKPSVGVVADGESFTLHRLEYGEVYHSVLFDIHSQILFLTVQSTSGLELRLILPSGQELKAYQFSDMTKVEIIAFAASGQLLELKLVSAADNEFCAGLNLVTKVLSVIDCAASSYSLQPAYAATYTSSDVANSVVDSAGQSIYTSDPGEIVRLYSVTSTKVVVLLSQLVGPLDGLYVSQDFRLIQLDLRTNEQVELEQLPPGVIELVMQDDDGGIYTVVSGVFGGQQVYYFDGEEWVTVDTCEVVCSYRRLEDFE